jgi:hypothetical protein
VNKFLEGLMPTTTVFLGSGLVGCARAPE